MRESFFARLLAIVAPPRATERTLRDVTLEELQELAMHSNAGTLPYHDPRVRALVWEVKYYANKRAARLCGALLADTLLAAAAETIGTPLLIPLPMHPTRRKQRGHNQTEILCEAALAQMREACVDYAPQALARTRHTASQQGLPQHRRLKNVRKSMVADPSLVRSRSCIVLDDVTTTGATFAEAIRALRAAGARSVECIALAQS